MSTKKYVNDSKTNYTKITITIIISVMLISSSSVIFFPQQTAEARIADKKEFLIASWTITDFGDRDNGLEKINDEVILAAITGIVEKFDIVFIQELVNETSPQNLFYEGFNNLCNRHPLKTSYNCLFSGYFTTGTEGYGVLFKNNIDITRLSLKDTVTDFSTPPFPIGTGAGQLKYPPMHAEIVFGNDEFLITVYNVHTNLNDVLRENTLLSDTLTMFYNTVELMSSKNVIVLGNLNAGSVYYPAGYRQHPDFPSSHWSKVVRDVESTVFGDDPSNPQAFDRMILTNSLANNVAGGYAVLYTLPYHITFNGEIVYDLNTPFNQVHASANQTKATLSEHKLVFVEFKYGGIESTDDVTNILKTVFMDYKDPPNCNTPDIIYFRGEGFLPGKGMDVYITDYLTNQNTGGAFKIDNIPTPLIDARNPSNQVPTYIFTDKDGIIDTTQMWQKPTPGMYNIIVDVNEDGYFTNSIDVVDVFDAPGLLVTACQKELPPVVEAIKDGKRERDGISGDPMYMEGSNLPGDNPSKKRKVFMIPHDSKVSTSKDTIHHLLEKSVFSSDVYITSDGTFDRVITWENPTPGIYNIILDIDNDDTYTPGIDVIDYTDEYGFLVHADPNVPSEPLCVIASMKENIPWYDYAFALPALLVYVFHDNEQKKAYVACISEYIRGPSIPADIGSRFTIGDINGDYHVDLGIH